jgi:hypothetical protein
MPSTNLTAATATEVTLGVTITQDVSDTAGTNHEVWFKYTAVAGQVALSIFGFAATTSNYRPVVTAWTGPTSSPVAYPSAAPVTSNRTPLMIPVDSGTTYYFRVRNGNATTPTDDTLKFSITAAPTTSVPAGSLFIPDDRSPFPGLALSATDGTVLKAIAFPAGEQGVVAPNGTIAHVAEQNGRFVDLYSPTFVLITSVTAPVAGRVAQITADQQNKFYIATRPDPGSSFLPARVQRVSTTGTVEATWTLPHHLGVQYGMGVSPTGSILYYRNHGVEGRISRYDLSASAALSDLIAGSGNVADRVQQDLVVLTDGTVLAVHGPAGATSIKRYSTAGATLNTYTFAAGLDVNRIAISNDTTSFWVWLFGDDGEAFSRFQKITISSGAVATTFDQRQFSEGAGLWSHDFYTVMGDAPRFAHSNSCPLLVLRDSASTPPTSTPPTTTPPDDCPCPPVDGGPSSSPPRGGTPAPTGTGPIGGGGFGKSGPNEGGEGWEPSCAGGGTVSSYATASAGESMVGVRDPRIWTEIAFDGGTTYWSQDVSIPDVPANYGGRKDGRVLGIGKVSRSLSDDNGNYTGSKVTVDLNDKDRASLRTRLGSNATRYIWEREGIIRLASETNRRTGYATAPRELFRGMSKNVALAAQFTGKITFEDRVCSQFGQFGPDRSFSSRLLTTGLFPGCPRELVGKPQQWIFGEVSDEGATDISTGAAASKGLVPIWLVGTVGSEDEYHLCAHEIVSMTLYGSDGGDPATRVLLTSGYRYEYKTITDTETGLTHGVTSIYLPTGSVPSEAHKNGRLTMAANVCGVKGANGSLITDLFKQYQYIFEHLILPEQESLTGAYVGSPQWADGRYMVHSTSFTQAQTYSIARIGGTGYQGGFVLGGPAQGAVTLRDLLKRMSNSGDCWFTWSHGGQVKCVLLDDASALGSVTNFREPHQLRELPTPEFDDDEVENPVLYAYDWDDDKNKFRVAQESVTDDLAADRMGRPRPSPSPIQMRCVREEATAQDVAQRRLLRRKYPPAYYPVVLPIDGVDVEPGDLITITSQEGVGSGSDERPLFVRDWSFDPKSKRTTLYCRDLTDILGAVARWADATTPAYASASTTERETYAFWADDDGIVTTNVDGKEWR